MSMMGVRFYERRLLTFAAIGIPFGVYSIYNYSLLSLETYVVGLNGRPTLVTTSTGSCYNIMNTCDASIVTGVGYTIIK